MHTLRHAVRGSGKSNDRFCCKGCEFVYDLIHDEGLDRYYTLRQNTPVKPVRERAVRSA